MIYTRMAGGLGNQLYQLAAALTLDPKQGRSVFPLVDALSAYATVRTPDSFKLIPSVDWASKHQAAPSSILKSLVVSGRIGRWAPVIGVSDRNFWQMANQGINEDRTVVMDGYFQTGWTESFFQRALSRMNVIAPSSHAKSRVASNECVIHIRGGDFLKIPLHQVIDEKYYIQAIKQAKDHGWVDFAIVSDDCVYASHVLNQISKDIPTVNIRLLPSQTDALVDFDTLRIASARIIGNSTFSWWAAALDHGKGRTWSPNKFTTERNRDFELAWESIIPVN
jgi:hypothetical protein